MGCKQSTAEKTARLDPNNNNNAGRELDSNKKGKSRCKSGDNNNNNNNNNKTKKPVEECEDGDDIQPFSPSPSLRQWYNAQVEDVQRLFNAPGAGHDRLIESTPAKNAGGGSSSSNYNKKKKLSKGGGGGGGETPHKPGVLTFYHVAPVKHIIGRGYYSEVMLADMTIHTTTRQTISEEPGEVVSKSKSGGGHGCRSSVLVKNTSTPSARESVTIAPPTRYLIACKEYTLKGDNANYMYKKLREEVQRLTRLGFSSRLLKVLQMESVYDDPTEPGDDAIILPDMPEMLTLDSPPLPPANANSNLSTTAAVSMSTTIPPPPAVTATVAAAAQAVVAATAVNSNSNSAGGGVVGGNSSIIVARQLAHKPNERPTGQTRSRTPNKVRIYMEYARYGTLRNMLLTEIPEKFGKTYMHELMVRAYMRDVLVALAFLHENNEVHTDLCAKNVYLVNHIQNVYSTCFPAYIADIPAGKFSKVPADCVRRVLALMDPASMHLHYHTDTTGHLLNDSVISNAGWNPQEKALKQNVAQEGDAILLAQPTMTVANTHNNINNNNINNNNTANDYNDNNMNKGNYNAPDNENNDKGCHWMDDDVKLYLRENAYTDDENIPLPSPLSSVEQVNVFKSPNLEGVTIVRGGSFCGPSRLPIFPPLVLGGVPSGEFVHHNTSALRKSLTLNNNSSMTWNNNNNSISNANINNNNTNEQSIMNNDSKIDMHPNEEASKRYSADLTALSGTTHTDLAENSMHMHPAGRRRCKPLIKLGHYGRIRSILVGEGDAVGPNKVHRLGRVTHLAPEIHHGSPFTPASDIYAFAMLFVELSTPLGGVFADLAPAALAAPRTRQEKDAFDAAWLANIKAHLRQHSHDPPLPPHLSPECQAMLRRCLRYDPERRPTAVELLQSKYFLFGHWAKEATASGAMEAPWLDTNYEAAAEASGLPRLPSDTRLYETEARLRATGKGKGKGKS